MNQEQVLEQKRRFLKRTINESLLRKHDVEINISEQFDQLKRIEITLEKIRAGRSQEFQPIRF